MAVAKFEVLRSLAFGSISGTYAALGTPLEKRARLVKISNSTDAPILVSVNGVDDHDYVPAMGFVLYDIQSNQNHVHEDEYLFAIGTQFSIKQVSAPTSGSVYLTTLYGEK